MKSAGTQLLRSILVGLKPNGESGFEGLVQRALEEWTGYRFFGLKSGRQEGRDGGTGPGPMEVAFEAKRYDKTKHDERELLGELCQVANTCPDLDLYVIASTAAADELLVRALRNESDRRSISLLFLDWQEREVPALAVFFAKAEVAVHKWFLEHRGPDEAQQVQAGLIDLAQHPRFEWMRDQIGRELAFETMGQAALQARIKVTTRQILTDRGRAKRKFSQFLAPLDPKTKLVERPRYTKALDEWWADSESHEILAVLGKEGVGKTWIIPNWWLGLPEESAPVLVVVPSLLPDVYHTPLDGFTLLAEGIAHLLLDSRSPDIVETLRKKLVRWCHRKSHQPSWIVVLDGANEAHRHNFAWAETIDNLVQDTQNLGVRAAVTSRREFWRSEVRPRMSSSKSKDLSVEEFNDDELARALSLRSLSPDQLNPKTRELIRNPRLLMVADSLLPEIGVGELTRERLLLSYWRVRLQERGSLIGHNDDDMRELIVGHARRLREKINKFRIDDWKGLSGAAGRLSSDQVQRDLSEIVDGRFFESDGRFYAPRDQSRSFALGLLLLEEVRESPLKSLDDLIDPIHGDDETAEVLGSAAALALIDQAPSEVTLALFARWLGLQNLPSDAMDDLAAYVPGNITHYLDLLEVLYQERFHPRRHVVIELLKEHRDNYRVRGPLIGRLNRWMGLWSLDDAHLQALLHQPERDQALLNQDAERKEKVLASIKALSPEEKELFERLCPYTDSVHLPQIAETVALIAASWDLAFLVPGLLAWVLTVEIPRRRIPRSEVGWLFQANPSDFTQTRMALLSLATETEGIAQSFEVKNAVARLHAFAGLPEDLETFNRLFRFEPKMEAFRKGWHWLEAYCDTDPLDPNSSAPTNLRNAENRIEAIPAEKVCASFWTTEEQRDIEGLTGGLARFHPSPILDLWYRALQTFPTRSGEALRQLIIALRELSPILRLEDIRNMEFWLDQSLSGKNRNDEELTFLVNRVFEALLPHLEPQIQLRYLTRMQRELVAWLDYRLLDFFGIAEPSLYADALKLAIANGPGPLAAVLFFACSGTQPLNEAAQELIEQSMTHLDPTVRGLTFQIAALTRESHLLNAHITSSWSCNRIDVEEWEGHHGSRALATASSHAGQPIPFSRISPELWDTALANHTDSDSLNSFGQYLQELVMAMISVEAPPPPSWIARHIDDQREFASFCRRENEAQEDIPSGTLNSVALKQRQKTFTDVLNQSLKAAKEKELPALMQVPPASSFHRLAHENPDQLLAIVEVLLGIEGHQQQRVRNWALALVPAAAQIDEEAAANLYRRFYSVPAFVRLMTGPGEIPHEIQVLMKAEGSSFDVLREEAFLQAGTDARITMLVISAEQNGHGEWVRGFAHSCLAQRHPMRIALGLTILGFCDEPAVPSELLKFEGMIGDLAANASKAKRASERNVWARYWHGAAVSAKSCEELWGNCELLLRTADFRFDLWLSGPEAGDFGGPWRRFGATIRSRLLESNRTKPSKYEKTLYGQDPPSSAFKALLGLTP